MAFTPKEVLDAKEGCNYLKKNHVDSVYFPSGNSDGYTILDLAIISGDVDSVKNLVIQGHKSNHAIIYAMQGGNKEIIKTLFENNFSFNYQMLFVTIDKKFKPENLIDCLSENNYFNNNKQSLENDTRNVLHHAAFIDFQKFQEILNSQPDLDISKLVNQRDSAGFTPFLYAAMTGNVKYLDYLFQHGANIYDTRKLALGYRGKERDTQQNALFSAVKTAGLETIGYLIDKGIDINAVDIRQNNILHYAVVNDDHDLVKFLLERKANFFQKDQNGLNVLHKIAKNGSPQLLNTLISKVDCKELLLQKDMYGRTPLDIAYLKNNVDFISTCHNLGIDNHQSDLYQPTDVSQSILLKRVKNYLYITNQNPDVIDTMGHCNGLSFMNLVYANRAFKKSDAGYKNDFYKIIDLLSKWDGSAQALERPIGVKLYDYDSSTPLKLLFREWTDHLVWFQQNTLEREALSSFKNLNQSQKDREAQLLQASGKDGFSTNKLFNLQNDLSENQLSELLDLMARRPGTKIEIAGGQHVVSSYVTLNNQHDYYDPNQEGTLPLFSDPEKLASYIRQTKYVGLLQAGSQDKVDISLAVFAPDVLDLNQDILKEDELPKAQHELKKMIAQSPNGMSSLHKAILLNSVASANRLLKIQELDFNEKDNLFEKTPFELAIYLGRMEILREFKPSILNFIHLTNDSINIDLNKSKPDHEMIGLIEYYVKNGCDIHGVSNQGESNLHVALNGSPAKYHYFKKLCELGAQQQLYLEDAKGRTPLDYIKEIQEYDPIAKDVLDFIDEKYPECIYKNTFDRTKSNFVLDGDLVKAIQNKNWKDLNRKISLGGNVNEKDMHQNPVLILLVHSAQDTPQMAELLEKILVAGADVNALTARGSSALDLAIKSSPTKINFIKTLCEFGAHTDLFKDEFQPNSLYYILKDKAKNEPQTAAVLLELEKKYIYKVSNGQRDCLFMYETNLPDNKSLKKNSLDTIFKKEEESINKKNIQKKM